MGHIAAGISFHHRDTKIAWLNSIEQSNSQCILLLGFAREKLWDPSSYLNCLFFNLYWSPAIKVICVWSILLIVLSLLVILFLFLCWKNLLLFLLLPIRIGLTRQWVAVQEKIGPISLLVVLSFPSLGIGFIRTDFIFI